MKSFLKRSIFFMFVLLLFAAGSISQFFYISKTISNNFDDFVKSQEDNSKYIILPYSVLDFQNKSGVTRLQSSFSELLIGSEGAIRKGNGYEVKLNVINPSSITFKGINCYFSYSESKEPATISNVNFVLLPGFSRIVTCFISDLSDTELKSISVAVAFDQISFHVQ